MSAIDDLPRLPNPHYLRNVWAFCALLLCALQVIAAPFSSQQNGNTVTYSSSSYGRDATIAGAALAITAGSIMVNQASNMRTVGGVVAPLVVRAAPVAGALTGVLLECFGNPACIAAVGGGVAIAVVAKELNFDFSTDPVTGVAVVMKSDPSVCSASPCYSYNANAVGFSGTYTSLSSACQAYKSTVSTSNQNSQLGGTVKTVVGPYGTTQCQFVLNDGRTVYPTIVSRVSVPPVTNAWVPSSVSELSSAIGAKTGWADNSKITDLLEKIVKNTSQTVPLQSPTVTGPTSIPSTPVVTTKADGSKTTTSKTTNFGYVGPTVTATDITTVSETTAGGSTTTTTTTSAPANADACTTNSNGVGCDTNSLDTPALDIPKVSKAITFTPETWFGGGTCPADRVMTSHLSGQSIKVWDMQQTCNSITTYFRPILLICASLSALMLLTPKGSA